MNLSNNIGDIGITSLSCVVESDNLPHNKIGDIGEALIAKALFVNNAQHYLVFLSIMIISAMIEHYYFHSQKH